MSEPTLVINEAMVAKRDWSEAEYEIVETSLLGKDASRHDGLVEMLRSMPDDGLCVATFAKLGDTILEGHARMVEIHDPYEGALTTEIGVALSNTEVLPLTVVYNESEAGPKELHEISMSVFGIPLCGIIRVDGVISNCVVRAFYHRRPGGIEPVMIERIRDERIGPVNMTSKTCDDESTMVPGGDA